MNEVLADIRDVWGDYDDFDQGGYEYAAFIIGEDLDDMEQVNYEDDQCRKEMADIIINAMRILDEEGVDPEWAVRMRLENHREKGQDDLIEKYSILYEYNRFTKL